LGRFGNGAQSVYEPTHNTLRSSVARPRELLEGMGKD